MSTVVANVGGAAQGVVPSKPGLPMPIILGLVGGGLGLFVFLKRKSVPTSTANTTLLPNTAIMLGSLQQGVLDLKGQVGTGNASLGNQIAAGNNATQALVGATTQQTQQLVSDSSVQLTNALNKGFFNQSVEAAGQAAGLGTMIKGTNNRVDVLGQVVNTQNQAIMGNSRALTNSVNDWFTAMFGNQAALQADIGRVNQSVWSSNGMTGAALANIGGQVAMIKKGP